jgi:hypothetical protein
MSFWKCAPPLRFGSAPVRASGTALTPEAGLLHWTQALGCNTHALLNAVQVAQVVGISVANITAHLEAHPKAQAASAESQ